MVLPKKRVPPPPKQPGTHTNAEVKEALHARAKYRTIIITAVVILLLAALAVVSSTAQEYQGSDDTEHAPKAIVIVADGLTPYTWDRSIASNKAPFTRLLDNTGGIYASLSTNFSGSADAGGSADATTNLVRLLTGATGESVGPTLSGATSFLRTLKSKFKPIIAAPAAYWSSNQVGSGDTACTRVGLFDSECTHDQCPAIDKEAYCNAYRKYVTCNNASALYRDDIVTSFSKTLNASGDILYVQMNNFANEQNWPVTIENVSRKRSEMNLLDSTVGRIALSLAERTKNVRENWLIIVTSEGANRDMTAPMLMAAYSNGQLVQLRRPTPDRELKTTDIRATLLKWFNVDAGSIKDEEVIGICSNGARIANCQ